MQDETTTTEAVENPADVKEEIIEIDEDGTVHAVFEMTEERWNSNAEWPQWMHEAWQKEHGETGAIWPNGKEGAERRLVLATEEGVVVLEDGDCLLHDESGISVRGKGEQIVVYCENCGETGRASPPPGEWFCPKCRAEVDSEVEDAEEAADHTISNGAFLMEIMESEQRCAGFEADWNDRKEMAALAKKRYETAVDDLRSLIRQGPAEPGLFDAPHGKTGETEPESNGADPTEEDLSWREETLIDLGLPSKVCGLAETELQIVTLGQLTDWLAGDETRTLQDLPGVGEAMEERIQECLDSFWTKRKAAGAAEEEGELP